MMSQIKNEGFNNFTDHKVFLGYFAFIRTLGLGQNVTTSSADIKSNTISF